MQEPARKPRADAQKNRTKLIEAAREILARGGPGASLEAVARAAGVGIGTLYRHFPTREALFQAVYSHEVEELIRLARALEAEPPGPAPLRTWLHALVGLVATKRGLLGALAVVPTDSSKQMYDALSQRMKAAVQVLLERGVAAGKLRGDVDVDDLLGTLYGLAYAQPAEEGWQVRVLRLLDIFVDGLIVHPAPPHAG